MASWATGRPRGLIVGSWDCTHCRAALRDLLDRAAAADPHTVLFVTRAGEGSSPHARAEPRVTVVTVPDDTWWGLVGATPPPVLLRLAGGELLD